MCEHNGSVFILLSLHHTFKEGLISQAIKRPKDLENCLLGFFFYGGGAAVIPAPVHPGFTALQVSYKGIISYQTFHVNGLPFSSLHDTYLHQAQVDLQYISQLKWQTEKWYEKLKKEEKSLKETRWHFKCTAKWKLNMYLRHISLLIDGNKDFVEKRFEIITLNSVHDKPLKRRHWKWEPKRGCVGELCTLNIFSAIIPNGFMIPIIPPFAQRFSHLLLRTIYT